MGEQPKPWMNEPWPSGPLPQGNDCLRIQPDTCVEPARLRTTPNGVEVKPEPASGGQGGFLDLRYPSHSMPPFREPADLATEVLDAMTRKLADYDRLSAALTSAQEAATKNLERARFAEDERNTYRASVESYDADVDRLGDELRELKGRLAAATKDRDTLAMQWKDLCRSIDRLREELAKARTNFDEVTQERDRTGRKLHEATLERDRLREERDRLRARLDDCDSKLTAMRVALSKAGIPESEGYPEVPADPYERSLRAGGRMLGAVERIERLCRERDEYKQAARVEASLGDEARAEAKALRDECEAMRAAKPQPKLTPLLERFSEPIESGKRRSEFDVGIEIEYEGMWDGDVGGWKLRTYGGTVYSAMYSHPVSRLAALIDVNTVLARYGYVLEAWP